MKYRSLLLHSCRCIVFGCLDSNLDLNSNCFFVFKGNRIRKIKEKTTSPNPSCSSPAPPQQPTFPFSRARSAQFAKSAEAPSFPGPARRQPRGPAGLPGPAQPGLLPARARPPAADGWPPPVIPNPCAPPPHHDRLGVESDSASVPRLSVFYTGNLLRGVPEVDECDSPRSVTRRKRHVAHNLDRFGPRGA
jgi:hypothetical protein